MADDVDDHRPRRGDVSALWERVESHGATIRQLTVEVSDQFRDLRAETSQQLQALATNIGKQVEGNANAIDRIATKLDSSAAAVAEGQKPRYTALFGGMTAAVGLSITIIAGLSALHDKPVDEKLTALTVAIGDLTKNTQSAFGEAARNTVSQREYSITLEYQRQLAETRIAGRDALRAQMQRDIQLLDTNQKRVSDAVVPRTELEFHWNAEDKRDAGIEAKLHEIDKRIDGLAPAGDYLRTMGERQHELELRVYGDRH